MLTLGLVTGFVYAKVLWGRFWSWDFKELFSMGTWLVYAVLLHLRLYAGWRGRKSAIMTIVGFGIIVFTFLGVNLFWAGITRNLPNSGKPMPNIVLIGINHKTAPVALREKLSFSQEGTLAALETLNQHPGITEVLIFPPATGPRFCVSPPEATWKTR